MDDNRAGVYDAIVATFQETNSVNKTVEKTGVAKLTVQKVLITEGLWESKRSREVIRLKNEGYTTEEIAGILHINVKGVQAYLPYSRNPYGSEITVDSIKSKRKREKKRQVFERQINEQTKPEKHPMNKEGVNMGNVLQFKPVETENHPSKVKKPPSLFKLHLELVRDDNGTPIRFSTDENALLKQYANFNNGFSRDIIVPADITLHSLHYAIQRLFGWENSHLRQFSLLPKDFTAVTNDMTSEWLDYCGVYFRFPLDDDEELYWDDDYDGRQGFKTWLKQKYKGPYHTYGPRDTYYDNQEEARLFETEFEKRFQEKMASTLDGLTHQIWLGGTYNCLLERIRISELLVPRCHPLPKKEDWRSFTQNSIQKVRTILDQCPEELIDIYIDAVVQSQFSKNSRAIASLDSMRAKMEPKLLPFVREIVYQYDFGDNWCISISCDEAYYFNDLFDVADNRYIVAKLKDEEYIKDWDFYRVSDDCRVDDTLNELLRIVEWKKLPSCVEADGLNLVDDVGGIHGYIDFIKTLHGKDKEEARGMRVWAESLGWSPRMSKPEKML